MLSTADLLPTATEYQDRLDSIKSGLSDSALMMVVEWRARAGRLRQRARWFLRYIAAALITGIVLVITTQFLVQKDITAAGRAELGLLRERTTTELELLPAKIDALNRLKEDAEKLRADQRGIIGEMQSLLLGGGTIWQQAQIDTNAALLEMHFANEKTGWVIGSEGTILNTTNGETWTKAETSTKADLLEIHFADEKVGWVIGSEGTILSTTDGRTWQEATTDTTADLFEMHFADSKTGWVIGREGTILYTTDGQTWEQATTDTTADLIEMHFADSKTGWVIGREGTILYTDDGKTWTKVDSGTTENLIQIYFADAQTGWIIGRKGTILHTSDGITWAKVESPTTATLWETYFADAQTGWIIGGEGTILRTVDGMTWTKVDTDTSADLYEIYFAETETGRTGWVVGKGGTVLHTTDGETWTRSETDATTPLWEISFADATTGWVIGMGGTILHTTDGETWTKAETDTTTTLTMMHFANVRTGWVIGFGGTLLITRDYNIALEGLTIGEQIELARSTPLNALFKKKGYLNSLQAISKSFQENQQSQNSLNADIEASTTLRVTATSPARSSPGETLDRLPATRAGGDNAFGAFFLQSSIIRITTILLIAFLVQILVGLYRYNTRLAGYFDARADSVLMTKYAGLEFEKLVALLSPDNVRFGRQPTSPANNAVELGREILRGGRARP